MVLGNLGRWKVQVMKPLHLSHPLPLKPFMILATAVSTILAYVGILSAHHAAETLLETATRETDHLFLPLEFAREGSSTAANVEKVMNL